MDLKQLSGLTLPDLDGEEHRLGGFWSEHRVVLVFLRHFG